ncbi:hypothetical protein FRB94_003463 [Tulasnella sp. JGI-2019a]|nr:hypothetical protein FRB93_000539 [Tulasnella sp. JGI-2019a]KAG9002936.1 hypothetical protein FRB94_003463 [Tulasnella sp. JGI-2019a]KAG9033896.1 hypothetical protein FRB95_014099 [Tulasnella sp. JGI-2019a]
MSVIARALLHIWHFLYSFLLLLKCLVPRSRPLPIVDSQRKQIPGHVAIVLHLEDEEDATVVADMIDCTQKMADWCCEAGVDTLTIYDEKGVLKANTEAIIDALPPSTHLMPSIRAPHFLPSQPTLGMAIPSHVQYPLTPPASDAETTSTASSISSTSSITPIVSLSVPRRLERPDAASSVTSTSSSFNLRKRTRNGLHTPEPPLRVNLICRDQGKPALARTARQLAFQQQTSSSSPTPALPQVRIADLNAVLQAELPEPELLIVHPLIYPKRTGSFLSVLMPSITLPKSLELYGFPPWQIRLSEIYYDPLPPSRFLSLLFSRRASSPRSTYHGHRRDSSSAVITEVEFRRALDAFGRAEMKVGK